MSECELSNHIEQCSYCGKRPAFIQYETPPLAIKLRIASKDTRVTACRWCHEHPVMAFFRSALKALEASNV